MNQIAIDFYASQELSGAAIRCAEIDAAVLSALSAHPLRSLKILIALWHDYTHDDVKESIGRLLDAGKIVKVGTTKTPDGWNPMNGRPIIDEIYGIKDCPAISGSDSE